MVFCVNNGSRKCKKRPLDAQAKKFSDQSWPRPSTHSTLYDIPSLVAAVREGHLLHGNCIAMSSLNATAKFNVQPTTRQMKKNAAFLTSTMEQTISAKKWFSKIGNFIRSGLGIILITTIYLGDFFGIVQIFQSQMYPFKDSYLGNIN